MPGAADFLKGGGSTSSGSSPSGGGGAAEFLKTTKAAPKKKGGLLKPLKSLLGVAGGALSMPQQVLFKGTQAVNDATQGQFGAARRSLLGAFGEAATLGQAGGDIDIAHAFRQHKSDGTSAPLKLPKGFNTGIGVIADPLNFVTLGAGSAAKQATKVAAKEFGVETAEQITKVGLKKALSSAEQATLKDALVREATDAGAKNAEKTAAKQLDALVVRGRGGVGFHIPGTNVGGAVVPGKSLARAGEATGLTAARDALAASRPVRALGRGLVPGRAVAEAVGKEAGKDVLAAAGRRSAGAATKIDDLVKRTEAAMNDFEQQAGRAFDATDDQFVHAALEAGPEARAAAVAQRPELARVIDTFDDMRKTMGREQLEAGVLRGPEINLVEDVPEVVSPGGLRDEERYLHRVLTPEAQKALAKQEQATLRSGGSASSALRQGAAKARKVAPEYNVRQINEAIETLHAGGTIADTALGKSIKDIAQALKPGEKLYKESAVTSLIDRGVEAAKAIASADYVKELRGITDDLGEKIMLSEADVAKLKEAGAAVPEHFVKFDLPKLGTFYAPKELKAEIVGAMGRLDDVDGLRKALDSADRWWRSQVTASLPGGIPFATRNARSNVMLMWLSGTNVPKYMAEGAGLQRAVRRVLKTEAAQVADEGVEAAMRAHLSPRQFKVWDYARKSGITGDAFYTVELSSAPKVGVKGAAKEGSRARRVVRAGFGTEGAAATKGRALNEAVEQHARLSQFLSDVDKLGSLEEAARRTKDVLFDYSALTPTEKKIKRWGMPFYTFARKNVPGQVRRFIEAPGRFVLPEKLAKATTGDLPEGSPEYQERQGSRTSKVPFGGLLGAVTKPERPFQAAVANFEPLYDLASGRGQEGLRGVASNLGGVPGAPAKAIFEQATGTSVFTGYKLPKSAAERQKLALQTGIPSLARAWAITARLPTATEAQKKKLEGSTLAQILSMAGVVVTPVNEKEMKRQKRLADAAKQAEKG